MTTHTPAQTIKTGDRYLWDGTIYTVRVLSAAERTSPNMDIILTAKHHVTMESSERLARFARALPR